MPLYEKFRYLKYKVLAMSYRYIKGSKHGLTK